MTGILATTSRCQPLDDERVPAPPTTPSSRAVAGCAGRRGVQRAGELLGAAAAGRRCRGRRRARPVPPAVRRGAGRGRRHRAGPGRRAGRALARSATASTSPPTSPARSASTPGSEVRILGIPVGVVTEVVPEGETVRVELEYDGEYDVPADAQAAVISRVGRERPVRAAAAGVHRRADPGGGRRDPGRAHRRPGRARPHLRQPRRAVGGPRPRGRQLRRRAQPRARHRRRQPRRQRRGARRDDRGPRRRPSTPWPAPDDDLFETVRNLQTFTTTLAENDQAVTDLNTNLATVSDQLAGEREDLALALQNLADRPDRGLDLRPGEPRRAHRGRRAAGVGHRERGLAAGGPGRDAGGRARPRCRTSATPTTRGPGRSTPATTSARSRPTRSRSSARSSTARWRAIPTARTPAGARACSPS